MLNPLITSVASFDFAGTAQKLRDIRDLCGEVVITFSIIANFVPRAEAVVNPSAKRVIGVIRETVEFLAMNRFRGVFGWARSKFKSKTEVTK